ncbi:endonuclease/exonuclease/phosphatase family protein [Streptomyces ovatisporus]|uniref:Endonuclease/exonuclease/phosphatase family protein n=1 Tax=Streptomyces ovatisporus TaxID=1128682 RepID=A0ABV9A2R1_9ACTN
MRPRTRVLLGAVAALMASGITFSTVSANAATDAAPAGGSPAAAAAVKMKVATHNVWRGKATFKPHGDVIGWQEMNTAADRKRLRTELSGYGHFLPREGAAGAVPISWRKDTFKLIKADAVLTHKGEARVTPSRYVTWALLEHRAKKQRFVMMNTHFISGAWSKHPERQGRWLKHADKLRSVIKNLHGKHPELPVFVVGDFNRPRSLKLPGSVQYIRVKGAEGTPIDQAYATRSVKNTLVERLQRFGSDHFAYRFTATF